MIEVLEVVALLTELFEEFEMVDEFGTLLFCATPEFVFEEAGALAIEALFATALLVATVEVLF